MFSVNLDLKTGESVLILTDVPSKRDLKTKNPSLLADMSERAELARSVYEIAKKSFPKNKFFFYAYEALWQHGKEPWPEVARFMLEHDVIVAITTFSLTHTNARRRACKRGSRIASMPGVVKDMFYPDGSLNADHRRIKKSCEKWKGLLEGSKEALIETREGTELKLKLGKREYEIDDGFIVNPGDYGNLPAGEVCGAPLSATGKLIIPKGWYPDLEEDITLVFKRGYVSSVEGGGIVGVDLVKKLGLLRKNVGKRVLSRRFVAEFGIGTNPKAKRPDNVLEAEKIKGTVHVAIGDNTSYPGGKNRSDIHLDFILPRPTVRLDGKLVIKNGKWKI